MSDIIKSHHLVLAGFIAKICNNLFFIISFYFSCEFGRVVFTLVNTFSVYLF